MTEAVPGTGVRSVTVPDDRDGQRLDNFLLGQLKGAPRSLVYKLVRSGQVRVNGGRAKAERKLEAGDEVRIPPVRVAEKVDARPAPAREFGVIFEDEHLLAIDKPAGVAVHGGSGVSFGGAGGSTRGWQQVYGSMKSATTVSAASHTTTKVPPRVTPA